MTNGFDGAEDDDRAIAAFMARVAALPATAPARDPMLLWWKAQLVQRWDAERRAQAPLDAMERVEIVAGVAAAVMLLAWTVPTVGRLIAEPFLSLLG